MYRAAMQSLLSELARQDRLSTIESITVDAPKTKLLATKLKEMDLKSVLIVVEAFDEKLHLASRNLVGVNVMEVSSIDPVSLLYYDKVLMTVGSVRILEEKLG